MHFEVIGSIDDIETIATGRGIRELARLQKQYGQGRWRKLKGVATVLLPGGNARTAEIHLAGIIWSERRLVKNDRSSTHIQG